MAMGIVFGDIVLTRGHAVYRLDKRHQRSGTFRMAYYTTSNLQFRVGPWYRPGIPDGCSGKPPSLPRNRRLCFQDAHSYPPHHPTNRFHLLRLHASVHHCAVRLMTSITSPLNRVIITSPQASPKNQLTAFHICSHRKRKQYNKRDYCKFRSTVMIAE